jgi:integrase/recombinase XerD
MKALETYLTALYRPGTVKLYLRDAALFMGYMGEAKALKASYGELMEYLGYLRSQYTNARTVNRMLYGVKIYYDWLLASGQRSDHPARSVKLKDAREKPVQLQDLFTAKELQKLLERKERYQHARLRNELVISLLIYQALQLQEITGLELEDVNLEAATLYIRKTPKTNARTLKLEPSQVMLFYRYLHELRPRLIKKPTSQLLLTLRGSAEKGEGIGYLLETMQHLYPDRKLNARSIRQSVLHNMLQAGKDLRLVQVFAGHKKVSSTEKYRQTGLEELKAAVLKHHPLDHYSKG